MPAFLRGLSGELRDELLTQVADVWAELRALQAVWDEISATLDGVDPVHPETKTKAEEATAMLRRLAEGLGGSRRLKEPDERMLDLVRDQVDKAFDYLCIARP